MSSVVVCTGLCISLALSSAECVDDRDMARPSRIVPDKAIQSAIETTVRAFAKINGDEEGEKTGQAFRELRRLVALTGKDRVNLMRQLIYFQAHATDEFQATIPDILIRQAEIGETWIVTAIAPLLDTEDLPVCAVAARLATLVENAGDGAAEKNFSYYAGYLATCKRTAREPDLPLIERMFGIAPGLALVTLASIHLPAEPRPIKSVLWAEHVVADVLWKEDKGFEKAAADARPAAIEQLDLLSKREDWWARLYVAEIIREHKELRTPELIARLEKDEHPLVHKLIAERDQKRTPPLNRPNNK